LTWRYSEPIMCQGSTWYVISDDDMWDSYDLYRIATAINVGGLVSIPQTTTSTESA